MLCQSHVSAHILEFYISMKIISVKKKCTGSLQNLGISTYSSSAQILLLKIHMKDKVKLRGIKKRNVQNSLNSDTKITSESD